MARKSARKAARPIPTAPASEPPHAMSDREQVIDAFMGLLAEKPIEQLG